MVINKSFDGNVLNVALEGRFDTMTAPELEASINSDIANADSAVIDMSGVEYVSSAGLRVLLSTHKKLAAKNGLIVKNVNDTVMEVFEVTGFNDIFTIE